MTVKAKMLPAAIIEALQNYEQGVLPVDALNGASEQWADCWPEIKANMYECSKNLKALSEEQYTLLFYGALLSAQQCEHEAYPLLLIIFDNNDDGDSELEHIFGDVITTLLPSVFYILGKGDYEQLNKLICSPSSGKYIKASALDAIAAKHESGQLARDKLVALVRHWLDAFVSPKAEVNECFLSVLSILCIERNLYEFKQELIDLAHNGKLDPFYISPMEIEDWKPRGIESLASGGVIAELNVVAEMSKWDSYSNEDLPDEDSDWIFFEASDTIDDEALAQLSNLPDDWLEDSTPVSYIAPAKIGRNDPCVCGSGKKYKKCCL